MALKDEITKGVTDVLAATWDIRDGTVVPTTDTVKLKDGAVKVEATYLYADLAGSSTLAQKIKKEVTGKIIRSYLNAASKIINNYDGGIRSFDGDRVMAIFMGKNPNTRAVRAAMGINWAVHEIIKTKIETKWKDLADNYTMSHGIAVANGDALIVRGGVRNNNDLVSIGAAPNVAAKLSDIRSSSGSIYVTKAVYDIILDVVKYSDGTPNSNNMWTYRGLETIGGVRHGVYQSTWWKIPT